MQRSIKFLLETNNNCGDGVPTRYDVFGLHMSSYRDLPAVYFKQS